MKPSFSAFIALGCVLTAALLTRFPININISYSLLLLGTFLFLASCAAVRGLFWGITSIVSFFLLAYVSRFLEIQPIIFRLLVVVFFICAIVTVLVSQIANDTVRQHTKKKQNDSTPNHL